MPAPQARLRNAFVRSLVSVVVLSIARVASADPGDTRAASTAGKSATEDMRPGDRPRIGLVLGGGGAKGAAHVGVLSVLEELRIPIDCVVGTSMGALVGGTFAAGRTASEVDEAVRAIS
ncbi:MAG: esterase, partial [Lysobacterales bacterium]